MVDPPVFIEHLRLVGLGLELELAPTPFPSGSPAFQKCLILQGHGPRCPGVRCGSLLPLSLAPARVAPATLRAANRREPPLRTQHASPLGTITGACQEPKEADPIPC